MTSVSHLAATYLTFPLITKIRSYQQATAQTQKRLSMYSLILSILIDIDALILGIPNHHNSLLHYPVFWLILTSTMYHIGRYKHSSSIQIFALATLFTTLLHLFLDLFGRTIGIHLFWPFSTQEFSLTPLSPKYFSTQNWLREIPTNIPTTMYLREGTIIVLAFIRLIRHIHHGHQALTPTTPPHIR